MTNFLEELRKEFESEGIGRDFTGEVVDTIADFTLGKGIDENGQERFFLVNGEKKIDYVFEDENQARKHFELLRKGDK